MKSYSFNHKNNTFTVYKVKASVAATYCPAMRAQRTVSAYMMVNNAVRVEMVASDFCTAFAAAQAYQA